MMRRPFVALLIATALVAGCGSDPTTSDEYRDLEQDLAAITVERDQLAAQVAASNVPDHHRSAMEITDEWFAALQRRDGSVAELYWMGGFHLYGTERYSRIELVDHLQGDGSYTSEWTTDPYVLADDGEGAYVVARGIRNSLASLSWSSAVVFEITTSEDGALEISQTAFIKIRD
jgi:hypothetical protein